MSKKLQCQNCHQAEFDEGLYEYGGEILCRPCVVARVCEGNIPCEFIGYCNDKTYPNKDQQLAELKEENFELVNKVEVLESEKENLDRTLEEAGDEIEDLKQQLKEKDEEIEWWKENWKIANKNCMDITKQVCEKIRNKFPKDYIPDETTYYLHEFLDQIEKGEEDD